MIEIKEKKNCCGCNACVQVCPKQCISMKEDREGFLYPEVDKDICVDCHLCEKVCLVLNQGKERKPLKVYAAKNENEEIRRQSSSGGIFTLLAEQVIDEGGVVFGARFNENWEVVHSYTETKEGLAAFRGSKYVQSRIGDNYKKAEEFLKSGRKVLFSGTPCQIAGLNLYLRKEYENLLTVDFICHGVPSPGVWREYLKEEIARQCDGKNSVLSHSIEKEKVKIKRISFRDKKLGWKKFSFVLTLSVPDGHGAENTVLFSEPLNKNLFLRGFLADLYLRPSCYACPAKCLKSRSDVTIGDFWGIEKVMPEMDDDKGVSVVMVNRGIELPRMQKQIVDYEKDVVYHNLSVVRSVKISDKRMEFFIRQGIPLFDKIQHLTKIPFFIYARQTIKGFLGHGYRKMRMLLENRR